MSAPGIVAGGCQPGDASETEFDEPVTVEVDCRLWDLRARPELLVDAAQSWRDHGDATSGAAEEIHRHSRALLDAEQLPGDTARRFDAFEADLIARLDQYEGISERVAEQLEAAAETLRAYQKTLDGILAVIRARVPEDPAAAPERADAGPSGDAASPNLVFRAHSAADLRVIADAESQAQRIRAEVDNRGAEVNGKLREISRDLGLMGRELTVDFTGGDAAVRSPDRRRDADDAD